MRVGAGATDVTTYFKLVDSTNGTPETGYTITNLDLTYVRDRATSSKTDATALGSVDAAHGDNKAIEVDATNCPGLYRVDWPDAAFAAGVDKVQLVVNGTGLDPAIIEVEIGGTPADVVSWKGTTLAAPDTAGYPKVTIKSGKGTGEVDLTDGFVKSYYSYSSGIWTGWLPTAKAGSDASHLVDTDIGYTDPKYDDCFVGYHIFMWSGDNLWRIRRITDYDAATNTFTFNPPLPSAISPGDFYNIIFPHGATTEQSAGYADDYYEEIADKILDRDIDQGGNGGRTVEEALAFLRNKWTLSGSTLTVYDTDDSTPLWTAAITKNASADPVTGSDPA